MSTAASDAAAPQPIPLDEQDRAWLQRAAELQRPLRRCAAVARGSGWSMLVLGGLSALVSLLTVDPLGLGMGVAVAVLGLLELRSGAAVRRAESGAATRLGRNQLVLLGAVVLYAAIQMTGAAAEDARTLLVSPAFAAQLDQLGGRFSSIQSQLESLSYHAFMGFYTALIAISAVCQGGLARYYFKRRRAVLRYLEEVPAWARDTLASMAL